MLAERLQRRVALEGLRARDGEPLAKRAAVLDDSGEFLERESRQCRAPPTRSHLRGRPDAECLRTGGATDLTQSRSCIVRSAPESLRTTTHALIVWKRSNARGRPSLSPRLKKSSAGCFDDSGASVALRRRSQGRWRDRRSGGVPRPRTAGLHFPLAPV
jgi:hypothetical protein